MSRISEFKARMAAGDVMAGTFVKTPSHEIIEVLARSGLDFLCLDAEHAPFDRARLDACLAIACALDLPTLVRPEATQPHAILQALDMGAVGIVAPHIATRTAAEDVAKAGRYGLGGRGYAGSTRFAGWATEAMPGILKRSQDETVVIAQIEEPEGVDNAVEIAEVDGIDGIFLGPADLSVGYGYDHQTSNEVMAALASVGKAATEAGKVYMTFVPNAEKAAEWRVHGVSMFFVASEHTWMLQGARAAVDGISRIE